ncbi:MAG: hypothetical protein WAM30_19200 [Candidatus Dormiibacterota bacterium]
MTLLTSLMLAATPNTATTDVTTLLQNIGNPVFSGAQILLPIVVVLVGIHKLVEGKHENHTVLLAELAGIILVMEGAIFALKQLANLG